MENKGNKIIDADNSTSYEKMKAIVWTKYGGADHVIDYTQEDFTKSGETYDVIFDVVCKNSFSGCIKSQKKKGIYLFANRHLKNAQKWTLGDL